jgi:hypothetical protein
MLNISKNVSSHLLASCRVSLRSSSLIWWKQPKMQSQTIMRSFLKESRGPKIDGRKEQFNIMQYLCNFSCSYGVVQKAWESIQSHEENASQVISSYLTNACIIAWVWEHVCMCMHIWVYVVPDLLPWTHKSLLNL